MTTLLTLTDVSMHFNRKANPRYAVFGDINLTVDAGECVALVGRNGSGKSTLLRVMAKIFAPTSGTVNWAPGVAVSLLTLGLGFRPDLSGRDNAFLSCLLMGLSRKEAKGALSDIETFCDLGQFFDEIVICFDGDDSGYKAALRAAENSIIELKPEKKISFLFLPDNHDPDSFVNKNGKDFFLEFTLNK